AREKVAVRTALAELSDGYATVLRLYYFDQWSVRQIAAHLSISVATVKWRLHRGRHLLREQLAHIPGSVPVFSEVERAQGGRPIQRRSRNRIGSLLQAAQGRRRNYDPEPERTAAAGRAGRGNRRLPRGRARGQPRQYTATRREKEGHRRGSGPL